MKILPGICLVVTLGLSAAIVADEGAAARPAATGISVRADTAADADNADRGRPRTIYHENPYIHLGASRVDVRPGATTPIPPGWTHADAAARRRGADPYRLVKLAGGRSFDLRGLGDPLVALRVEHLALAILLLLGVGIVAGQAEDELGERTAEGRQRRPERHEAGQAQTLAAF